ncbi:MAG: hypothetical protein WA843_02640 [Candidatus Saccharimonadales bacterium]
MPRHECHNKQIEQDSIPVVKVVEALRQGRLQLALTEDGFTDFHEGVATACTTHPSKRGKLLVQLYFIDPSEVTVEDDEPCWLGLEYEFCQKSSTIDLELAHLFIPSSQCDPIDNPEFTDYAHIVIEKNAVAWGNFE